MNVIERQVLAAIERAAQAGQQCPKNIDLGDQIGVSGTTVLNTIAKLEKAGVIQVVRGNSRRIVTIVSSGLRTAGEIPSLHWRLQANAQGDAPSNPAMKLWQKAKEVSERRALESLKAKQVKDDRAAANYVQRDPCVRCQVRRDKHDEFGCRRYVAP